MLYNNSIKPNYKAIRVTSSIIQTAVLQAAFMSLFTLIIVHRKEYGYFRLGLIAAVLGLAVLLANSFITKGLTAVVKKAEPSQAQNCEISRILAQGPKAAWPALVTSVGVSIVFSVVLEVLSKNNMLDPLASNTAVKVLSVIGVLIAVNLLMVALSAGTELTTAEIREKQGFELGILEGAHTENSMINSLVAQVRANSYCKEGREL